MREHENPRHASTVVQVNRAALGALLLVSAIAYIAGVVGHHSLATDEAYSAWAASHSSAAAIIRIPVLYDPGKQIFYYLILHYFAWLWGYSEIALRSLSLIFAVGALALIYLMASELFDCETGIAAIALWILNPLAVVFAHQARCYSMFMFIGLAQMISLWRLRTAPTARLTALCAILGAALLYTHLAGLLIIGGETAMIIRDYVNRRASLFMWLAIGFAALLFMPYLPIALTQSHQLISGHWLDWAGSRQYSPTIRITTAVFATAAAVLMTFGPAIERREDEPLRWLVAWSILPIAALLAGSIIMRPMFNIRYLAPSTAALAILFAGGLAIWSLKLRRLVVVGFAFACLLLVPLDYPENEPWPQIAKIIAATDAPAQPIFFEAGFTAGPGGGATNPGFPFGYYSIPFDYYFHGPNPRMTIPGYDSAAARATIASEVLAHGGGWLISWRNKGAASELPNGRAFWITMVAHRPPLVVYRIVDGSHND
jgi:4-amino-4-deoxy-L-arabinose transferase-like glycosyltransferase